MKKIILILSIIWTAQTISAQISGDTVRVQNDSLAIMLMSASEEIAVPQVIPKSPEVQGFERYGEYPVSEYTGIPSINIPLHTIKLKDIEFPISLDYHAAGIQVTQEATWVGLGWNLMAGGCISITAMGPIDWFFGSIAQPEEWNRFLSYNPSTINIPGSPRTFKEEGLRIWDCVPDIGNPADINTNSRTPDAILQEGMTGSGERDIYTISFLGNSFKVSIHPITNQAVLSGEKNKFEVKKQSPTTWVITDDKGYLYVFSDYENFYMGGNSYYSTWHLSQIIYQGNILLKINYHNIASKPLLGFSEAFSTITPQNETTQLIRLDRTENYIDTSTKLHISSIISPLDSIVFTTKSRIDIQNGEALDQIIIYDKSAKREIKRYVLEQDYFIGTATGAALTSLDYAIKRLRLSKLYERYSTQNKGLYQFTYNDIALPYKTSFSQDLWGYYNGQSNATTQTITTPLYANELYDKTRTLVPSPVIEGLNQATPAGFFSEPLANRLADPELTMAGMLKSITYPTGGRTEFEFESHTFTNQIYPPASVLKLYGALRTETVINNGNPAFSTPSVTFENEKEIKAKIKVLIKGEDYTLPQMKAFNVTVSTKTKTKTYEITDTDTEKFNSNNFVSFEEEIILPAGRVTMSSSVLSDMPYQGYTLNNGVQASLTFYDINQEYLKSYTSVGGGVRVKKITNYSDDNLIASTKTFEYIGGKLIYPMKFYMATTRQYGENSSLKSKTSGILSSGNFYNYAIDGFAPIVGYDQVTVESKSISKDYTTGKIISNFINKPTKSYYDYFFFPVERLYTNGKLSKRIILNAESIGADTLKVENFNYSVENFDNQFMNIKVTDSYAGASDEACVYGYKGVYNKYAYRGRFNIVAYPTNSYTVHLMKKEEIDYFGKNVVKRIIDYVYDPDNFQVKKITEILGDKKNIKEYVYSSGIPFMATLNMVSMPIEEKLTINAGSDIYVKGIKTTYAKKGNQVVPVNIQVKNSNIGAYEPRLEYHNHDSYINPLYISKDDATHIVYLWSYNGQYPVAEIKNATYETVRDALGGEAEIQRISSSKTFSESDLKKINDLRDNSKFKNSLITTYTYKPLIGIESITDPRGVVTTYGYDDFGRLEWIKDSEGKLIESYKYHYATQETE